MEEFYECPQCGATLVNTLPLKDYQFQYGETGSAVILRVAGPVRIGLCLECDFQWTADDFEDAMDAAVKSYLELKARFLELASILFKETGLYSNMRTQQEHAAYKEINAMGMPVVPILLDAMRAKGEEHPIGHWFLNVQDICDDVPEIPEAMRGRIRDIEALYVNWGVEKGLIA